MALRNQWSLTPLILIDRCCFYRNILCHFGSYFSCTSYLLVFDWRINLKQMPILVNDTSDIVYETCLLLVTHFRNLVQLSKNGYGFNSRIFSHILHPEKEFVYAGQSEKVTTETPTRPEHVVPCAVLRDECKRLIKAGTHSDEQIAQLLQKHWKIAIITKKEQETLDFELGYKSIMPNSWTFETGNTFERFKRANIILLHPQS